jgi:hypothetical protein
MVLEGTKLRGVESHVFVTKSGMIKALVISKERVAPMGEERP